jgi:poly(3-hydroxybutyrate) depolymerase
MLAFLASLANAADAQEQLGSFNIDPNKVSISGISSGAFMANQFHIAHSELIMGVGNIAGGLYTCAVWRVDETNKRLDANITRALDRCMFAKAPLEPVETYRQRAEAFAEAGWIDPLSALDGDKVYLFTGRADSVVNPAIVERAAEVYRAVGVKEEDLRSSSTIATTIRLAPSSDIFTAIFGRRPRTSPGHLSSSCKPSSPRAAKLR